MKKNKPGGLIYFEPGDLIDGLEMSNRVVRLEDAFVKLFDMLMDKTRPENCYVKEWYVHKEYDELKTIVDSIKDSK